MHQHPDSIVVPLSDAKVRFNLADGKSEDSDLANEAAMYTPAGTHSPTNLGKVRIDAVLVEFKAPKPGTAVIPTSRPGMTVKQLAEGPRAVALRSTADASFNEPAGSKHDYDQVVIALKHKMPLSIDGKPAKPRGRAATQFIGRGARVEEYGRQAGEYIIVLIK